MVAPASRPRPVRRRPPRASARCARASPAPAARILDLAVRRQLLPTPERHHHPAGLKERHPCAANRSPAPTPTPRRTQLPGRGRSPPASQGSPAAPQPEGSADRPGTTRVEREGSPGAASHRRCRHGGSLPPPPNGFDLMAPVADAERGALRRPAHIRLDSEPASHMLRPGGPAPAAQQAVSRVGFAKRIQPSDLAAGHLQGPARTVTQSRTTSFPWSGLSKQTGGRGERRERAAARGRVQCRGDERDQGHRAGRSGGRRRARGVVHGRRRLRRRLQRTDRRRPGGARGVLGRERAPTGTPTAPARCCTW